MRRHLTRPADADFSAAWYLVLVLPWAVVIAMVSSTGLREMAQPSAATAAELAELPPAA